MNVTDYAQIQTYNSPHYESARQLCRYARRAGIKAAAMYREDALRFSLKNGTNRLAVACTLDTAPRHYRGLTELNARRSPKGGSQGDRFTELSPAVRYDEETDTERVELMIHAGGRGAIRFRRLPVGALTPQDARLILPLLREGLRLFFYVTRAALGAETEEAARVEVVVSGAAEAGREWIDAADDRAEARKERRRPSQAPAAYVQTGGNAYAGHNAAKEAVELRRETVPLKKKLGELEVEAGRREHLSLDASYIGKRIRQIERQVARKEAEVARAKERLHRSKAERIEAPTVEDFLREDPALRPPAEQQQDHVVNMQSLASGDYWHAVHVTGYPAT